MLRFLLALLLACTPAFGATLLPPGKQQFLLDNGAPNAGGSVYFYVPGTTTPKNTYQNAAGTILNTNPVGLDSGGFAVIYGSGAYREVVKDASGNTIYDQLTSDTSSATSISWGGTSTGSANAIVVAATEFSAQSGQTVVWENGFTNTGSTSITINGVAYTLYKDGPSGPIQLTGGELMAGGVATAVYESGLGGFHLEITSIIGGPFPGEVRMFAMNTCPVGWQETNGAAISRTGYPGAFAAMGTTWGVGDGSTTFNVPDLRGTVPRAWDHGRGLDPAAPAFAAYEADSYAAHNHGVTDPGHTHQIAGGAGSPNASISAQTNSAVPVAPTLSATTGITINNSGAAETRAKSSIVLYCVKL